MDFVAPSTPSWAEMTDTSKFFAYMHTYDPFNPPIPPTDADFRTVVTRQARRLVDFIRGEDQPFETVGSVILPASRNRKIDYDNDGDVQTWRLGDIVHSTPKLVQIPSEAYDLLYRDYEYTKYYLKYRYRRNVIYAGANDGMLHAFNGGFYNQATRGFELQAVDKDGNSLATTYPTTAFELGAELWAYVPYNLLTHLHWLEDFNYGHVYYNDIEPKIFDAKIYDATAYPDTHPGGYATLLVGGMRFGGGKIAADLDKEDGAYNSSVDTAMSSAYYILDITNPEAPPKVLAEITFPDLGFTTCYPAAIAMRNRDLVTNTIADNEWYLIFGSGPASQDASGDNGANTDALINGTSSQQAVMYVVDLVKLAQDGELWTVTNTGKKKYSPSSAGPYYLTQLPEANSSVSQPVTVDWELDWNADAAYFGVSFTDASGNWGGKLRRIVMQPDSTIDALDPSNWLLDSVLVDLSSDTQTGVGNGQPIQTAVSVAVDQTTNGNRWIYFGTGRYYSALDAANTDQQSYYGIKEPYTLKSSTDPTKIFSWNAMSRSDLLNVTDAKVYHQGDYVEGVTGVGNFEDLESIIDTDTNRGWYMDLVWKPNTERNLGRATLIGKLLTFTSFVPSTDPCIVAGQTQLYALYYRTGTAYIEPVIGLDLYDVHDGNEKVIKRKDLGDGLSITPNIHVGRSAGSTAYIQGSTGEITDLEQKNPGSPKTGPVFWEEDHGCP
jgi:type IV pilus assembly protein PilY1